MEISISLRKDYLIDYIGYLFEPMGDNRFKMRHGNPAGKLLASFVRYSDHPVNREGNVIVHLTRSDSLSTAPNKFCYITVEDEAKFNDYLDAMFYIDYDRWWIQGVKLGLPQQDIILAYVLSRNIGGLDNDLERLKKRTYRATIRNIQNVIKQLQNKAAYADKVVRESIKKHPIFFTLFSENQS